MTYFPIHSYLLISCRSFDCVDYSTNTDSVNPLLQFQPSSYFPQFGMTFSRIRLFYAFFRTPFISAKMKDILLKKSLETISPLPSHPPDQPQLPTVIESSESPDSISGPYVDYDDDDIF